MTAKKNSAKEKIKNALSDDDIQDMHFESLEEHINAVNKENKKNKATSHLQYTLHRNDELKK